MIGVPTSTVEPSVTSSSVTVPAYGLGSSTAAFAVSISTMVWLTVTVSPGWTYHLRISRLGETLPDVGELELLEGRHAVS